MDMLTLKFKKESGEFSTETNIHRTVLATLKTQHLLEGVLPETFPETFKGQVIIDPKDRVQSTHYLVKFYTELQATDEMQCNENHEINLGDEPEDCVWFEVEIPKQSDIVFSSDREEIVLCF